MSDEKQKILDMVEKGAINGSEAARLLEALGETEEKRNQQVHNSAVRMKGKKLRVLVSGIADGSKVNVNVSIPLVLARYADNIMAKCVPDSVDSELKKSGFDIRALDISGIVDTFEEIEEDIVNVDVSEDNTDMKVRVYVE